ncbi:Store-operated calcium entry-associated regulatory factor [uncultured virus]|nr:Store-operated calcium entry-associated regulatory factor [uncultured virus]
MRVLIILILFALVAQTFANGIPMSQIRSLTLYKGQYAARQRSTQLQLQCTGGSAGCHHTPNVVQCVNVGSDGVRDSWKCEAQLPNGVDFGNIDVACEGYSYPGDPTVLAGSCVLRFTLEGKQVAQDDSYTTITTTTWGYTEPSVGAMVLFLVIVFLCLMCICAADHRPTRRTVVVNSSPPTTTIFTNSTPPSTTVYSNTTPTAVYTTPPSTVIIDNTRPIYTPLVVNRTSPPVTTTTTTVRNRSSNNGTHTSTGYGTSHSE